MNKQEAADFLGCSIRQIERYAKENRIGVVMEKGRTRPTPVYDEGELRDFKAALARPVHRPAVERMETTPEAAQRAIATQGDGGLSALSQASQLETLTRFIVEAVNATRPEVAPVVATVGIADKLLLTLSEAQALTGLSRQVLRDAIESGELKARQIGRAFRLKRADLEKYIEGL